MTTTTDERGALTADPDTCPCGQGCTHTGMMSTLDHTGDSRIMWDKGNADEVKAAREHYDSMTRKGYRAYKAVGKDGSQGDLLRKFDADAERIIFIRAPVGG